MGAPPALPLAASVAPGPDPGPGAWPGGPGRGHATLPGPRGAGALGPRRPTLARLADAIGAAALCATGFDRQGPDGKRLERPGTAIEAPELADPPSLKTQAIARNFCGPARPGPLGVGLTAVTMTVMHALTRTLAALITASLLPTLALASHESKTGKKHHAGAKASKSTSASRKKSESVMGTTPYALRSDAMAFADDVADRRQLDRVALRDTLGQARLLPGVPKLMLPPAAPVPRTGRPTGHASWSRCASTPGWPSGSATAIRWNGLSANSAYRPQ